MERDYERGLPRMLILDNFLTCVLVHMCTQFMKLLNVTYDVSFKMYIIFI